MFWLVLILRETRTCIINVGGISSTFVRAVLGNYYFHETSDGEFVEVKGKDQTTWCVRYRLNTDLCEQSLMMVEVVQTILYILFKVLKNYAWM